MKESELAEKAKHLIINTFPEYELEDLDCHGGIIFLAFFNLSDFC